MQKYRMLRDWLQAGSTAAGKTDSNAAAPDAGGGLDGIALCAAPTTTDGQLALVHTPGYINAVVQGQLDATQQRDIGFPWSPEMVERSRRSVGATVAAARDAQAHGVAANLAGGTHHAYSDHGGGFCVFNDMAVAARLMQAEHGRLPSRHHTLSTRRQHLQIAIVDLDVHQGNGTAHIFAGDDSVFTLSMHGEHNFPFYKERSDLDYPLPDRCSDEAYLTILDQALDALDNRFVPDLLLYLAGADPHEGDRLGRMALTHSGLKERDRRVFDWAWQRRIPLAFAMGGGYGKRIEDTLQAQVNTFEIAVGYRKRWSQLIR